MENGGASCGGSEANPVRQREHSSWQLAGAQLALAAWCIYQQPEGGRRVPPETGSLCCRKANNNQGEMCKIVV